MDSSNPNTANTDSVSEAHMDSNGFSHRGYECTCANCEYDFAMPYPELDLIVCPMCESKEFSYTKLYSISDKLLETLNTYFQKIN